MSAAVQPDRSSGEANPAWKSRTSAVKRHLGAFVSGAALATVAAWFCFGRSDRTPAQAVEPAAAGPASSRVELATGELSTERRRLAAENQLVETNSVEDAEARPKEAATVGGELPVNPLGKRLELVYSRYQKSLHENQSATSQFLAAHTVVGHCIAIELDDAGRAIELAPDERASLSAGLPAEIRFTLDNKLYAIGAYEFPEFDAIRNELNTLLYDYGPESSAAEQPGVSTELVSQIDARVAAAMAIVDRTENR